MTHRFAKALSLAATLHADQVRKISGVPYIAHLLSVSAAVLEAGGTEDQAIAALLHDAVEDQGGLPTLHLIGQEFGGDVASIVWACTDATETPKPPWLERKKAHIAHIATCDADALLVIECDKAHNAQATMSDWEAVGDAVWGRFTADHYGVVWYYSQMFRALNARVSPVPGPSAPLERLGYLVGQMARTLTPGQYDDLLVGTDPVMP